jgi:hypothetical protein
VVVRDRTCANCIPVEHTNRTIQPMLILKETCLNQRARFAELFASDMRSGRRGSITCDSAPPHLEPRRSSNSNASILVLYITRHLNHHRPTLQWDLTAQ